MERPNPAFTMCAPLKSRKPSRRKLQKRPRPRAVAPPPDKKAASTHQYNPSPSIDNVIIAPSLHGQGLFLRPGVFVPPHQPIARIPLSAALVAEPPATIITSWIPSSWWRSAEWDSRLAVLLLYHIRHPHTDRWRRYAASLPNLKTAADLPMRELAAVRYPPLIDAVEAGKFRVQIEYDRLHRFVRDITTEEFEWAMKVVHSRTFAFPSGVAGVLGGRSWPGLFALIPVLDMANHASRNAARVRYDNDTKCFVLQAGTRGLQGGEEIFVKYGNLTTDDTFLHYGFVEPENPYDYFEVEDLDPWVAGLPEAHKKDLHEKLCLLERLNLHYEGRKFFLSRRIDHDLLAALRVLVSTTEEFEVATSFVETYNHQVHDVPGCSFGTMECVSKVMPDEWRRPLGRENEMRVWGVVERVCRRLEKSFSVSDDLLPDSVRLFHVGKRRVLREVGAVARRRRELWEAWVRECESAI